jgi:hypothetical protein
MFFINTIAYGNNMKIEFKRSGAPPTNTSKGYEF